MSNKVLENFLYPEIFLQFPNIKHAHIESEHPDHHWNLLPVKDEIVLDLGCGFHMIEPGWDSTPKYFIKKQAAKIIGVDTEYNDIATFKKLFPLHSFYHDAIDSSNKVNHYIDSYNITSLKMDIEGEEIHFINSDSSFPTLKHVAIETHNKDLLNHIIKKLDKLDFKINTVCTFYPRVYNICNLVYASR